MNSRIFVRSGNAFGLYDDRLADLLSRLKISDLTVQRVSRVEAEVSDSGKIEWRVDMSLSGMPSPEERFPTYRQAVSAERKLWTDKTLSEMQT